LPGEALGATKVLRHRIFTSDDRPINVKQYRYPQVYKEEIQRQVDDMLEKGVIEPSSLNQDRTLQFSVVDYFERRFPRK